MARNLTLDDYLSILWRRRWIVLPALIIVPVIATFVVSRQPKVYQASSQVLLSRQDIGSELLGFTNPNLYTDPTRFAETQAAIARTPALASRVVAVTHARLSPGAFLGSSDANPNPNADYLVLDVRSSDPVLAAKLATAYAEQFTVYRRQLDTAAMATALTQIQARLAQIRKSGGTSTAEYGSLQSRAQQLRLYENLQTSNTYVLKGAEGAAKIKPNPRRTFIFAVLAGLLLGICLAFVAEALDRRVHTSEEVEEYLGLPLLARVPEPGRPGRRDDELAIVSHMRSPDADAYRVLRTNFMFLNHDLGAKVIMITSSVPREGKSTTTASLAVTLARAGHRVAVVDLDLHSPSLNSFFGVPGRPGFTDVALRVAPLDKTMRRVPHLQAAASPSAANGRGPVLDVITSGTLPLNPGEFVESKAAAAVLDQLRDSYDFVLVDVPPLLPVSDAMSLSAVVDAVIVLARIGLVERGSLRETARVLARCPAPKLGVVITGVAREQHYYYGGYGTGEETSREPVRVS